MLVLIYLLNFFRIFLLIPLLVVSIICTISGGSFFVHWHYYTSMYVCFTILFKISRNFCCHPSTTYCIISVVVLSYLGTFLASLISAAVIASRFSHFPSLSAFMLLKIAFDLFFKILFPSFYYAFRSANVFPAAPLESLNLLFSFFFFYDLVALLHQK